MSVTPPLAMTGIATARARATVASTLQPLSSLEAAGEIGHRHVRHIGPATGGDHAVARVDGDDDAAGIVACRLADQVRILQRGRADHHAADAEVEPALDRFAVADAAAKLDLAAEALEDRGYRRAIDRFAGKGAVEIDDMQPFGAGLREDLRLGGGIVAIDGGAGHVALGQAHDLAGLEVDGGEDDQAIRV